MVRLSSVCSVSFFLWSVSVSGLAETPASTKAEPDSKITVLLYNYARVPDSTLTRAKRVATRIFRRAEVETAWRAVPLTRAEAEASPASRDGLIVEGLALGVLARSMTAHLAVPRSWLGFAQIPKAARLPTTASVFLDRVEKLAWDWGFDRSVILGHVMAHEMGHLLLAQEAHTRTGIMSLGWKRNHLRLAAMGQLLFSQEQAARMRANVQERQPPPKAKHRRSACDLHRPSH